MSVHLCVYLLGERLPTRDAWQAAIDAAGVPLTLEECDTRILNGFLPCRLDGLECGFEYYFQALEQQEDTRDLGDCDRMITFILHGQMTDWKAAMYAAAALTEVSGGTYYDPQGDVMATGRGVYALMREDEERARERGRLAAERDAAITNSRCPHCDAPCPSYRKTCKACGRLLRGPNVGWSK